MTTSARINSDIRMIAAGLAANEGVIRPGTITATGRAAQSQFAIVPSSYPASFALLAHVDYHDVPDLRPGGGFIGGRNSSIVPFLDPSAISAPMDLRVVLKQLPCSRDEIRRRLRGDAGLWWAPGAVFSLVGWEDDSSTVWADHLRENGPDAVLSIAQMQAMAVSKTLPQHYETLQAIAQNYGFKYGGELRRADYESLYAVVETFGPGPECAEE